MKRNIFEEPKIEVLIFDSQDGILTASSGDSPSPEPILPDDNWDWLKIWFNSPIILPRDYSLGSILVIFENA